MANADAGLHNEDDVIQGQPVFLLRPTPNVYSYFMFIGPTETKRQERKPPERRSETNWDVLMGYLLVAINFFMQTVLLYLIFEEVVVSNVQWQNGILKLGGPGGSLGLVNAQMNKCNDGGSLCFLDGGSYSCAPPSIQLTGRWDELDLDRDGIWTRAEVEQAKETLKCKYFVDPVEVFDVLIRMLKERQSLIWLHSEVLNGNAIHLPYFTYIMADVIMCSYRSEDMCANLLERGYFHVPLKYGTSPRVGPSIESALKYCRALLMPGGTCERSLPSTYAVWKVSSTAECGAAEYSGFTYTNPGNNSTKSLLSVDYSSRVEYDFAQDMWFMSFKAIIIFLWLLMMSVDIKDVYKVMTFCARMPDASNFGQDAVIVEQDPADPEDVRYRIRAITRRHRMMLITVSLVRVFVVCVLSVVGVAYLIKTNAYADLIMNGVALVFIAEISSVLFDQVLREEIKDQTEDIKPIPVRMYGWDWLNDRPALIDMLWMVLITVVTFLIMSWQLTSVVVPVHDALQCACLSQGDRCVEAHKYNFEFWHEYWLNGIPGALKAIDVLKVATPAPAASYLGIASQITAKAVAPAQAASYLGIASQITASVEAYQEKMEKLSERVGMLENVQSQHAAATTPADRGTSPTQTRSGHHGLRGQAKGKGHGPFGLRPVGLRASANAQA
jgi:hypothetical protein